MSIRSAISGCLFATLVPFSTSATTINFDDLEVGVAVGSSYAGVTFNNALTYAFGLSGQSSPISISSISDFTFPQQGNPISAVFASAVNFVSLTGLDIGDHGFILKAFDAAFGGTLLDSVSVFGTGVGVGNFATLSVSGANILRVEFSQATTTPTTDGMTFDNFTYELAAVPLPASLPLGLIGIGGLAFMARRRKSA